jgi:hypothetical protein
MTSGGFRRVYISDDLFHFGDPECPFALYLSAARARSSDQEKDR